MPIAAQDCSQPMTSRAISGIPRQILTHMENNLRQDRVQWTFQRVDNEPWLRMLPSSDAEIMIQSCPLFPLAIFLSEAKAVAALSNHNFDSVNALLARAMRHAQLASTRLAGNIGVWSSLFAQNWPAVHSLPASLWTSLGCVTHSHDPSSLTLSDLVVEPMKFADVRCLGDSVVFSPMDFFSSQRRSSMSPRALFRALLPRMALRPASFRRPGFLLEDVLEEHVANISSVLGLILDFGVGYGGSSTNSIARHVQSLWQESKTKMPVPRVFGFDSFQGLHRDWKYFVKGAFKGEIPAVEDNVQLIVGWFNDTVGPFLRGARAGAEIMAAGSFCRNAPMATVSLAHFDADLYESTSHVLQQLLAEDLLGAGSILVFDDLLDFGGRAFAGHKENWNALYEALRSPRWRWRLEVLAAPWFLDEASLRRLSATAAFKLIPG